MKTLSQERQEALVYAALSQMHRSQSAVAREQGVSRQYVHQIRTGRILGHLWPDMPRDEPVGPSGDRCGGCLHYAPGQGPEPCGLGMPEARPGPQAQACGSFLAAKG